MIITCELSVGPSSETLRISFCSEKVWISSKRKFLVPCMESPWPSVLLVPQNVVGHRLFREEASRGYPLCPSQCLRMISCCFKKKSYFHSFYKHASKVSRDLLAGWAVGKDVLWCAEQTDARLGPAIHGWLTLLYDLDQKFSSCGLWAPLWITDQISYILDIYIMTDL